MNVENDTLSRIKSAALSLFNKKGYTATTTREIANEVGIKSSTLYFYFKSKEDIFFTLHKEAMDLVEKKSITYFSEIRDASVEKKLYIFFYMLIEFFSEQNLYYRFIYRYFIHPVYGIEDHLQKEHEKWRNLTIDNIYELFSIGKQEGLFRDISVENLLKSYYRYQNGFIHELIIENRIPSKEEIDEAWEIFWNGIKA